MHAVGTPRLQSRRRVCSSGVMRTTSRGTFGLPALLITASTNRSSGRDARGYRWSGSSTRTTNSPTGATAGRSSPRLLQAPQSRWSRRTMRRIRGHHSRDRAFPGWLSGDWWWSAGADRLVRPLHAARCPGWGLRRDPRRRCTYDGRPDCLGGAAAGQGHAHRNLYWAHQTAPGRTTGTVDSKDVDFGGPI